MHILLSCVCVPHCILELLSPPQFHRTLSMSMLSILPHFEDPTIVIATHTHLPLKMSTKFAQLTFINGFQFGDASLSGCCFFYCFVHFQFVWTLLRIITHTHSQFYNDHWEYDNPNMPARYVFDVCSWKMYQHLRICMCCFSFFFFIRSLFYFSWSINHATFEVCTKA